MTHPRAPGPRRTFVAELRRTHLAGSNGLASDVRLRSGGGTGGGFARQSSTYHEALGGKLSAPLVPGVPYLIAFNDPPIELTGTALIIVACYIFRYGPTGIRATVALLSQIDKSLEEASQGLGAGSGTTFRRITLPLILPVSVIATLLQAIWTFNDFALPFVLTGGGPANATQMIVMYLYTSAFRLQRMGLASAMGYLVFMLILVLTLVNFRLEKKWVFYE